MKNFLFALLILCFCFSARGQQINGVVLDKETAVPIDYASVFFDGTFVGTTTDENGGFELDVTKYKARPLTISAVGYHPVSITEFSPGERIQVKLSPRVFELEEVVVSTKSLVRKRRACMRIFKNEFIGLTSNARKCYILNEEDITFNYGSDQDTLRAYASKPIHIQNLSLGYDISYHLDRFEYDRRTRTTLYTGSIIFNRDLAEDEESLMKYERRRGYAFTGSSKHFFRALWANDLQNSGFMVSNYRTGKELLYEHIVSQDFLGRKFLVYNQDIKIDYYNNLSYISFREFQVFFEQDGYFEPLPIIWTGKMSKQRIADFLPFEYLSPQ
ncbi:MAG: carboxypeptidase-like regulatory domain-containing protein [Bacteroidota bacterium]|nr:carboxypeptidase-like regulatory domain-containing protein [Bacteroidota bacterium]